MIENNRGWTRGSSANVSITEKSSPVYRMQSGKRRAAPSPPWKIKSVKISLKRVLQFLTKPNIILPHDPGNFLVNEIMLFARKWM